MKLRSLRLAVVCSAVLALCACSERTLYTPKQLRPIASETKARLDELGIDKYAPILMRVFKAEGKLEVWKQKKKDGQFALVKSYDICRWSGDLGPKHKEGDRQAPEGFYPIAPGQLNPRSSYFLAFDTGYPNTYDRAQGRTGSNLMVHGDCSSRGCFAMTDKQMQEIFALARDAFDGGQKAFQMQIMPFRMTAENFHRFRNNENIPFWRTLKEGSDHFEATLREPDVQVCGKHYVFNQRPLDQNAKFSPTEACPPAEVPADIAQAVAAKRKADDFKLAAIEADQLKGQGAKAEHTPLPVHAVYRSRQVIRASLPAAGPEALSLLPGAEAGPTPELRKIARGEITPAESTAVTQTAGASTQENQASAVASPAGTPSPAPSSSAQIAAIAQSAVSQAAQAQIVAPQLTATAPVAPANVPAANSAAGTAVAPAGSTPPPISSAGTVPGFGGLLGSVVSAFAPASERDETTAIAGIPAPDAPRPLPSPIRRQLSSAAPLPEAPANEAPKAQSDAGFLERTFGGLSLPVFGRPQTAPPAPVSSTTPAN